uniref:ATP synthase complex subunit 8 n=1 Tax=Metacrangonyx spinicaudatus TaxID=1199190 RepID=K7ZWS8_9CRUS|nr:ATP synthase F0 subunit 8 [Metacrangonyx spinicaudatus]CCI69423.1 ATP synthase F0 subunit 8 [Metacrangonyx spinicaudatus]
MPQMAPSLWLMVYVMMCFMVLFLSNILFFLSDNNMKEKKKSYNNKTMHFMWQ